MCSPPATDFLKANKLILKSSPTFLRPHIISQASMLYMLSYSFCSQLLKHKNIQTVANNRSRFFSKIKVRPKKFISHIIVNQNTSNSLNNSKQEGSRDMQHAEDMYRLQFSICKKIIMLQKKRSLCRAAFQIAIIPALKIVSSEALVIIFTNWNVINNYMHVINILKKKLTCFIICNWANKI